MHNLSNPGLNDLLRQMGQAGLRLSEIGACEGAAGNMSICTRQPVDALVLFPDVQDIELPFPVPGLAGTTILVTGSGQRLRDIADDPTGTVACIAVSGDGLMGKFYTSQHCGFTRVTSEFNSQLAVHSNWLATRGSKFNSLIHAQPVYLTFLSHIPVYQDGGYLNNHLLRWQPETILNLPEGIGSIPFCVPGSQELMDENVECLGKHQIALWPKHGVMARSDISILHALDLIDYAEAAARYEYLNLTVDGAGEGLSADEIQAIAKKFGITQRYF